MTIEFCPLEENQFKLLHRWLHQPHVARWWGDPPSLEKVIDLYHWKCQSDVVFPYLVSLDTCPIGYIQSYDAPRVGNGWWPDEPPGTWGIDAFIGERDCLGRGHGTALIEQFSNKLLNQEGVSRVIADPHPDNGRAIQVYERAGFCAQGQINTPEGPALLLIKDFY